jgi:hypothetical protein
MRPQLWPLLLAGCTAGDKPCPEGSERRADGLCYLVESDASDEPETDADSGEGPVPPTGDDPILTTGRDRPEGELMYEFVDAAMIDDTWAIAVGQGGFAIVDIRDASLPVVEGERRALRVDTDGQLAALSTRDNSMPLVDVSDPTAPRKLDPLRFDRVDAPSEDVSVDDGRILVAFRQAGAQVWNADNEHLVTIPADDAFAVALRGDRALITDGAALELWDLSDLGAPALLTSATLPAEGRDLSWEGEHVAVGMGGAGTSVWRLVDTTLTERGTLRTPGSALSVAVDGDRLWIGAWEVAALADLAAEPPVVLGHETPTWSAMAVAAAGGRALIADWYSVTSLEAVDGARGPELVPPPDLYFSTEAVGPEAAIFENGGTEPLELRFELEGGGFTFEPERLELEPGAFGSVVLTPEDGWGGARASLEWESNDADEAEGVVELAPADAGVGTPHVDFTLQGYQLPDESLQSFAFADTRDKVVVLVYWALF